MELPPPGGLPITDVDPGARGGELVNVQGWTAPEIMSAKARTDASEVVSVVVSGGEVLTVGMSLDELSSGGEMFAVAAEMLGVAADELLASATDAKDGEQADDVAVAAQRAADGEILFHQVSVPDREVAADLMVGDSMDVSISEVYEGAAMTAGVSSMQASSVSPRVPAENAVAGVSDWAPNWFNMQALEHSNNHRGGWLQYAWDNARMAALKGSSGSNVTFEPDYVTYNYDDRHYFDNGSSAIENWTSNLPCAYRDTSFMDGDNELVYTIGCHDAQLLSPNTKYFSYFVTDPGNTTVDMMKVLAQKGRRIPSFCHSEWCIHADDRERYSVIPAMWHPVTTREARYFVGSDVLYWME